ncbi:hypothetical protein BpHYR1_027776 [Brachionus plicatilis]|uniref:Uncharacterized protein n=1 Tax=Brachionus plicatilis TaxID=10195 RepID=A0A3M7PR83_BRAPC|nr:hypothetical protein BpHYR1_027776 [Brachionus plicatilis]
MNNFRKKKLGCVLKNLNFCEMKKLKILIIMSVIILNKTKWSFFLDEFQMPINWQYDPRKTGLKNHI